MLNGPLCDGGGRPDDPIRAHVHDGEMKVFVAHQQVVETMQLLGDRRGCWHLRKQVRKQEHLAVELRGRALVKLVGQRPIAQKMAPPAMISPNRELATASRAARDAPTSHLRKVILTTARPAARARNPRREQCGST